MFPGTEKDDLRRAIVCYLQSVGVDVRHWKIAPSQENVVSAPCRGVFGVPLHSLPLSERVQGVPQFLVNACEHLRPHLHAEGLFRKCGSAIRIKALRARLEAGENCLQMALPCDVAGLVKQFLRDLPDPLIPAGLQGPLCQVQQQEEDDGGLLTILLTCLLPQGSANTLRYFFSFLKDVTAKCAQNKMDLDNLAVVFTPNLFRGELRCKLGGGAEEQLQRQVAVLRVLISQAAEIGTVPQPLLEKVKSALDPKSNGQYPSGPEDAGKRAAMGRRQRRRSVGDIVTEALSKFKAGRALCAAPSQEPKEDSPHCHFLDTPFNPKRKASDDVPVAAELSAKKRKSISASVSSDSSVENAGEPFDQPVDPGNLAPTSSIQAFSSAILNSAASAGSRAVGSRIPAVRVQRQRSSCRKHTQRKQSGQAAPSCSSTPFELKGMGCRSLGIFSRSNKDLQPLPASTKATEPSSWLLMKKRMTGVLEGPVSPQRWARLPSHEPREGEEGFPSQSSEEDSSSATDPEPEHSRAMVTCRRPCLDGVSSKHRELELQAVLGHGRPSGRAEHLAGEAGPHRVLRRLSSWPEDLLAKDAVPQGETDSSPHEAPIGSGGHDAAQMFGLLQPTQPSVEVIVTGMRHLGIPAVCATGAEGCETGCQEARPGQVLPSPLPPKAHLTFANPHLCEKPKSNLKRLTLNFQRGLSLTGEMPTVISPSPAKRKLGRRFGRSLSHESGLPLKAGEAVCAGQGGCAAKRGATLCPPKSPLQIFKTYGRQISITRKHITMSLASLRSKKEVSRASSQSTKLPLADAPGPPLENSSAGEQHCYCHSPKFALAETQLAASQDFLDL